MTRSGIRSLIEKHGILPTPQRVEVAGILLDKPQHLSAEQIIERLKAADSGVSKATVYNTLNLFSERGLIREVMVDPVRKFYDSTTRPHHHFYNVDTGELADIPDEEVAFGQLPELPEGTERESVEVLIRVRGKA
ncbi:MAG: Fur family transcriptional regulator [Woeseiaceae bacterium]|nr:Fur family transcriptional regulator [Woeseiaceae bacterium]